MIEIIREEKAWNNALEDVDTYDFYHTYQYHQLSNIEDDIPILIKYTEQDILIAIPFLLRKIKGSDFRDLTSVYGYSGPLSSNIPRKFNNAKFRDAFFKCMMDSGIVSVFSRLNPYIPNQDIILKNLGDTIYHGVVVNVDLWLSQDQQKKQYSSRLRTHINKSRRNCDLKYAETEEEIDEFIDIYYENMKRVNADKGYFFSRAYFKNLLLSNKFKPYLLLALNKENREIIGGCLFVITNNIVQYHLGATRSDSLQLMPTKLLLDEIRLVGNKEGGRYFNLGGGVGAVKDSLYDFKFSYSKDVKDFKLWKYIVDFENYFSLVSPAQAQENISFFPRYRYFKS